MNLKIKRLDYNWERLEEDIGMTIYDNYKEFYETIGSVGIDDFIYIVPPEDVGLLEGLVKNFKYMKSVYGSFNDNGHIKEGIDFYYNGKGWLPVGYTTNGDFILVEEGRVMFLEGYFELREVHDCSLMQFIEKYLNDELYTEIFDNGLVGMEHEMEIIYKESHYIGSGEG